MSRWVENFDNHAFKTAWEDFKNKLKETSVDEAVVSNIEELARLNKITSFLDNAFENIDPEYISENILSTLVVPINAAKTGIVNYNSHKNIVSLEESNNQLDNLLEAIYPYMIHGDKLKKSLLSSIRAYTTEVNKHLEDIVDTETEYNKAKEYREEIEEYHNLLFDDSEDNEPIKLQIATFLENSEDEYGKINKFYDEILNDDENESIKTSIEEAKKDIIRDAEEANKKLVNVSSKVEKLDTFYINIFGSEDEEGNITRGLEKELELRIKALENFKIKQEKDYKVLLDAKLESLKEYEIKQQSKYDAQYENIDSLISGATSVGLSTSYHDMKKSFDNPIKTWDKVFMSAIGVMFFATFLSFIEIGVVKDDVMTWFSFAKIGDFNTTINSLLFKLPLYAPLIWLAIFASKRRSENQRLQQEYAHKEAVAKSYIGYKNQIDELGEDDKVLLSKLLDSSIDTVSHNASESLDKKHGDTTPAQETIKMFVEQVTKLTAKKP